MSSREHNLRIRAKVIQAIRRFFDERGYIEVETPLRVPTLAPESHIDAVPSDGWFLHTSPELCMKRLLAAGFDKIFQISKCFRSGECGRLHVPEFTLLEWYRTGADYVSLMDECEEMVTFTAEALGLGRKLDYRGVSVDFARPWERIAVSDAFLRYAGISAEEAILNDRFDELMVTAIEPHLGCGKPSFLFDYPVALGSLARRKADDPTLAERFELYIGGLELANAFSELTDVGEQKERFASEREHRRTRGMAAYPEPEKFLEALASMPEAAGIAFGIDRFVMLFTGSASIDEVVAFTPEEL
ncbi:MAG: EF-P lysine aminoacylase EpmA [Deltaproteobacteria bacterium]|nr:EF-P lysine aminoacylase EpmA [Deltaproteobacteria bacterium]